MPNVFEQMMICPVCGEEADTIITQVGKPTRYVHPQNNRDPIVHLEHNEENDDANGEAENGRR